MKAQSSNLLPLNPCSQRQGASAVEENGAKRINPELWHACAGSLVTLPPAGTHVVYFPQGHTDQVAASMKQDIDAQIPDYPNLPSKLLCILQSLTLHADPETDQVYAQMTLQPVPSFDEDALLRSDLALKANKPQPDFFCKTLTASDTSSHGGFSIPRRAADKIFPPLDFSMQPPAQAIVARDLHDTVWSFRHIFRGQPKRHLLTTGWSLFVNGKRLFAGDSVLFIRDEKQQLLLGIRRANKQSTNLPSSVLSSDSMHIGVLAAAAHAAANNSSFTVFYNPRASPSEFVIPLAKYYKAAYSNQIALGMRFRMLFETEDSGTRRYMGTITGIGDIDPVRWKNSQWRNLQVNWDESTAGEKQDRVSIWEIEPVAAPFLICPPPFSRSKRPRQPGMPDTESSEFDNLFKRSMPWLGDEMGTKDPQALSGLSLVQWMNMHQTTSLANSMHSNFMNSFSGSMLQNPSAADLARQLGLSTAQIPQPNNFHFTAQRFPQQVQLDQLTKIPSDPSSLSSLGSSMQSQQQLGDLTHHSRQNLMDQSALPSSQVEPQNLINQALTANQVQTQSLVQTNGMMQPQQNVQRHQINGNVPHNPQLSQQQQLIMGQSQQQLIMGQSQQQNLLKPQLPDQVAQHLSTFDNQIQLQLLQKLQQQHSLVAHQSALPQPSTLNQIQEQQRQLLDGSHGFSRSVASSQILEMPQATPTVVSQSNSISQQMTVNYNSINGKFSHPTQQQQAAILSKMPGGQMELPTTSSMTTHQSTAGVGMMTGVAGESGITDDIPSCSTSPYTDICSNVGQPLHNMLRAHQSRATREDVTRPTSTLLNPKALETMSSSSTLIKDFNQNPDVKPSLQVSRNQNHGFFTPQTYPNGVSGNMDYLDTSSSNTSVCLSQNDGHLQQNGSSMSYNPQSIFRDVAQDGFIPADSRNTIVYRNVESQMMPLNRDTIVTKGMVDVGKDFSNSHHSGSMLANYESKDVQQELSSSRVSNSFGVPDMAFNPIDPTIDGSNLLSSSQWAPPAAPPQLQRVRTYTKVYKRGAVGRSIDIARYSGYDELKQDLARRFGIEGQLEDRQRVGWKLVYVDHENDVLLVGDDPWEEFINCVRYIKILSPQEVQQMSLEGDFGNRILPSQACSSSDGGNA